MEKSRSLILCIVLMTLTSCAEFFEFIEIAERTVLNPLYNVELSPNRVDLLVGDSVIFNTEVLPDTAEATYRWFLSDAKTSVVSIIGKRLYARNEGSVTVYVEALPLGMTSDDVPADSMVIDSCMVTVSRRIEIPSFEFPYETIVIAALELADTLVTDPVEAARLTALVDGEVRGHAEVRNAFGIDYLELRIGSRKSYGEEVTIDYYNRELRRRYVFTTFILDGETHGTLSDPIVFKVSSESL